MPIKFTSNKTTLLSLIMPALSATSARSTLPALEGLLFTLKDNMLTVCGYDLEKGVTSSAPVFPREEGAVILNAQKISAIIRNFPDCDIKFEADDKNIVNISGAMSEFSIHGHGAEAFPALPALGGDNSFSISQSLLKEMINSTCFAVSQLDKRPELCGELFKIEGRKLTVVALDNYRLALREENEAVFGNEGSYQLIVPGKTLIEFSKLLGDSENLVKIEFTDKHIIFIINDTVFFCRLLGGEYLDYTRAIPKESKTQVKLDSSAFLESATRAALLVEEKLRTPLRCKFTDGCLNVSCSTQFGKVNDNIRIEKSGEDIEIGFNHKYLIDALRACRDEKVSLSLSTPLMSMMITPATPKESGSFVYLVLPCRMKD